ncbi:Uncharacterized protein FWK35_00021735 [Aphis craccivora]|uniref:Uncharacterized protein n=1 Tax=Aphis craccivora TaxID=307492 RepID=A0A6G0Y1D9_APHCR|nr:Uncharacterized protein FWK35_00021735 [Aphis craccivora]
MLNKIVVNVSALIKDERSSLKNRGMDGRGGAWPGRYAISIHYIVLKNLNMSNALLKCQSKLTDEIFKYLYIFEEKLMKNLALSFLTSDINKKIVMIFQLQNYLQIFALLTYFVKIR